MRPRISTPVKANDNVIVDRLVKIYGYSESITKRFYYHFKGDVASVRLHLKYMSQLGQELEQLEIIN